MLTLLFTLTVGLRDAAPLLVVMTITPLPARAPHIEAAAASFSTVMLSTSLGLMLLISPSYGKLSTTISGLVSPLIVLKPLTRRLGLDDGAPRVAGRSNARPFVTPSKRLIKSVLTLRLN